MRKSNDGTVQADPRTTCFLPLMLWIWSH